MSGQPFISPSTSLDRRRLGKFEVLCRLSAGGMSQIYLAHQAGIGGFKKLVVLKTILPDIGGEEDFVRMFLEEARTTALFNHPNIAQVYELDVDNGELFMAMEFVQGCTLVEMAKACRQVREPIPIGFTLQAVRDTALALHYAHTFTDPRGRKQIVIHRDVAEKNIMVTYEGVTKLLDFGIAKALGRASRTSIGMVKGTSGYMSPEQIRGEPLDARSDVFSLGVVAHECLTGLRLFHGKNPEEGMIAALNVTVSAPSRSNPQVTSDVDAVVLKALQRRRDDRFSTALEFARAIEKAAPGLIWHPEQSGDLVSRHFADRRDDTRNLLELAGYGETTGEIRIDSIIAKLPPASAESRPTLPPVASPPMLKPAPTPPTGVPNSLRRPTPPVSATGTAHIHDPDTTPARPKLLRGDPLPPPVPSKPAAPVASTSRVSVPNKTLTPAPSTPMAPVPSTPMAPVPSKPMAPVPSTPMAPVPSTPMAPVPSKLMAPVPSKPTAPVPSKPQAPPVKIDMTPPEFHDDSEEKTIPAAALPDEIKALRASWLASAAQKEKESETTKPVQRSTEPIPVPAHQPSVVIEEVLKPEETAEASQPAGQTLSSVQPVWEEEEEEAKTTIANPFDSDPGSPPSVAEEDEEGERRVNILIAAILVPLFVGAVLAVLYALGYPPFEPPWANSSTLKSKVEAPAPPPPAAEKAPPPQKK